MHRPSPLIVLCFCLLPTVGVAQTVSFDPPTDYRLVEGRLAVTFGDTVDVAAARRFVAALGYDVVSEQFSDVVVWAEADDAPGERLRAALDALPAVHSVATHRREGPLKVDTAEAAARFASWPCFKPYCLRIVLDGTTASARAKALVDGLDGLMVVRLDRRPRELVVAVPPGEEEVAAARLETGPLVHYVSYIHEPGQ